MIVGTSSLGSDETCSVLLMGDSGTGKTTTAAKFPSPAVVLLEKNGRNSIELARPGTTVLYCETYEDVIEAVEWLEANPGEYETAVFDSGTELDDFVADKVLRTEGRTALQIQDYKEIANLTKKIITRIKNLDAVSVFLYLEDIREYKNGDISRTKVIPAASGKNWQMTIPSLFSYVFKTCKFPHENSEGEIVPRFALEICSDENATLKAPPALQKRRYIPANPNKWLGLLLPERYPKLVPTKKKDKGE